MGLAPYRTVYTGILAVWCGGQRGLVLGTLLNHDTSKKLEDMLLGTPYAKPI